MLVAGFVVVERVRGSNPVNSRGSGVKRGLGIFRFSIVVGRVSDGVKAGPCLRYLGSEGYEDSRVLVETGSIFVACSTCWRTSDSYHVHQCIGFNIPNRHLGISVGSAWRSSRCEGSAMVGTGVTVSQTVLISLGKKL